MSVSGLAWWGCGGIDRSILNRKTCRRTTLSAAGPQPKTRICSKQFIPKGAGLFRRLPTAGAAVSCDTPARRRSPSPELFAVVCASRSEDKPGAVKKQDHSLPTRACLTFERAYNLAQKVVWRWLALQRGSGLSIGTLLVSWRKLGWAFLAQEVGRAAILSCRALCGLFCDWTTDERTQLNACVCCRVGWYWLKAISWLN